MNPVKLSTTVKSGVAHKSKIKMTPKMVHDEMNRIYYMRSVAKRNARIDEQRKRNLAKLRQLKSNIIEHIAEFAEITVFGVVLWPFKIFEMKNRR